MLPFQLLGLAVEKEKPASCTYVMKNEMYLQHMKINGQWACDEGCVCVAVWKVVVVERTTAEVANLSGHRRRHFLRDLDVTNLT